MLRERVGIIAGSATLFFDALIRSDDTSKLKITEHPVETGANISDHAYLMPSEITLEVFFSDVNGGAGYAKQCFDKLHKIQASCTPVTLLTKFKQYTNMMIETITTPDDYINMHNFRPTIGLSEINIVNPSVVSVSASASPHKTNATNVGTVQVDTSNTAVQEKAKSTLKTMHDMASGGNI